MTCKSDCLVFVILDILSMFNKLNEKWLDKGSLEGKQESKSMCIIKFMRGFFWTQ